MSKKKYERKANKILAHLINVTAHLNEDDEIRVLTKAIKKLGDNYAKTV